MNTSTLADPLGTTTGSDGPTLAAASSSQVPSATRPQFTITDAATACAVSRKTITRKLPELSTYGAAKDGEGVWRIPVEALLAVGLHPGRSLSGEGVARPGPAPVKPSAPIPAVPSTPTGQQTVRGAPTVPAAGATPDAELVTISRQRWDDLRIRLARAEAEASERSLALADARLALRALTAGPAVPIMSSSAGPTQAGHPSPVSLGQAPGLGQQSPMPQGQAYQAGDVIRRRRWWHRS